MKSLLNFALKKASVILILFFVLLPVVSQSSLQVINPTEGVWANKQSLVLDVPEGCEVYYSFTGSNPLSFGFAYDEPVLIDAIGSVPLRLAVVFPDGEVQQIRIPYTVHIPEVSWQPPMGTGESLLQYAPGDVVMIPDNFCYSLSQDGTPDIKGRALTLSGDFFPERRIPCTVTDGTLFWRFVIEPVTKDSIVESAAEEVIPIEAETPPFILTDWDYITFNRDKLIYCIDDGYWESATGSVRIDRTVPHKISWQSVAYEQGNPVYSIELPAKPEFTLEYEGNETAIFEPGNGYTVALHDSNTTPMTSFAIDAFYGEELFGDFPLDVYYKDLYQGTVNFSINIDKKPPRAPVIVVDTTLLYNRKPVTASFVNNDDNRLFYSVVLTAEKNAGFNQQELLELMETDSVINGEFTEYDGEPFIIDSKNGNASLYTIYAYNCDAFGNISSYVNYSVVIDPCNYYVSSKASLNQEEADGSLLFPFATVQEALDVANFQDFTRIYLDGMLPLEQNIVISSKCEINGIGAASGFVVKEGQSILLAQGANVSMNNCVLELREVTTTPTGDAQAFLKINGATLNLSGCELVAAFNQSGSVFSANSSSVVMEDCGVTIKAGRYASLFSGIKTNLTVSQGRYTAVAPTAVVFSLSAGQFNLQNAACHVYANLGRIAELSGVTAFIADNQLLGELYGDSAAAARVTPIWHDGRSKLNDDGSNIVSGFPGV